MDDAADATPLLLQVDMYVFHSIKSSADMLQIDEFHMHLRGVQNLNRTRQKIHLTEIYGNQHCNAWAIQVFIGDQHVD